MCNHRWEGCFYASIQVFILFIIVLQFTIVILFLFFPFLQGGSNPQFFSERFVPTNLSFPILNFDPYPTHKNGPLFIYTSDFPLSLVPCNFYTFIKPRLS